MAYPGCGSVASGVPARPLVSVIIPTRNRAESLRRALASILAQQGRGDIFDLEIIVVDDASSDDTPSVARAHADVHYIRLPERRGVSAATNVALRTSSGRYLTFLDDDDEWLPHKLAVQVPALNAHPEAEIVYGQSLIRSEGREEVYPDAETAPSGWVFLEMLTRNFAGHHASLLARRSAFDKAGYFDETLMSNIDYEMSLRLAFHVHFLFVPGAVDIYNLSPRGLWLTRAASGMGRADLAQVIENALRLLPDSPQYDEVKRVARARAALDAVYSLLSVGEFQQARTTLLTALQSHPWVLGTTWARSTLSHAAGRLALGSASPVSTTARLCAELRSKIPARTVRGWWDLRRALGLIWASVALSLADGGRFQDKQSAYAAGVAVVTMPSLLGRPGLVRLIVRGALGRRADAACAGVYVRLRKFTTTRAFGGIRSRV